MGCFGSRKSSPHPTVMFVIGGPGSGKGTYWICEKRI